MTDYTNAPKRLKSAVERLAEAERLLEDLARSVEIASVTGQIQLTDVYRQAAEEYLEGKLVIDYPDTSAGKFTIITNEKEKA